MPCSFSRELQMTTDAAVEIDYKTLLIKYIRHVEANRGVTFLSLNSYRECSPLPDNFFTDEEWNILTELDEIASSIGDQ